MTAKEYLSQPRKQEKEIKYLEHNLEIYQQMMRSIPTINYEQQRVDKSPSPTTPNMIGLEKYFETVDEIHIAKKRLVKLINAIEGTIDEVKNVDYKILLKYKYLNNLTCEEISKKMFVSYSTIKRWHKDALKAINVDP